MDLVEDVDVDDNDNDSANIDNNNAEPDKVDVNVGNGIGTITIKLKQVIIHESASHDILFKGIERLKSKNLPAVRYRRI